MDSKTQLVEMFQGKERHCKAIAQELAKLDCSVLAIALIGGCARGVVFPEDIDFLILVRDPKRIPELEHKFKITRRMTATPTPLFFIP